MRKDRPAYRMLLVGLLSLNFGIVFFDRNALNFLMPFVQPDLNLSNTEIGLLASALSFTWAISGYYLGAASDRSGKRKSFLVAAIIAFSLCSVLSGLATSFLFLLGARLLMGAAEGSILPISQSLTASEVPPEKRGLAMGVMQNFGSNLLGSFVAPVALVALATWVGWRYAFFLAGVPGIITALLIWRFIEEPEMAPAPEGVADRLTVRQAFSHMNILICAVMAVLLVSYLVIAWAFMPLYLTKVRGFDPATMGWLMGTLGISATVGSFIVPGLSDIVGRRPVMIIVPLIGIILPLGAMYFMGSPWLLAVIFFFGWA
ncbi:MAG TPA: MFS transporter, partial [Amphiplicatus sp.]|nr:MFS transporter [Amphiplicatus sp.]